MLNFEHFAHLTLCFQTARLLLKYQRPDKVGKKSVCIFLDDRDVKMVVGDDGSPPYELDRCGVALDLRMTFYDHVHTTGIDIRQALSAVAVVTLGKDMTLRDYSQGCWRMRALGKGQCIHLLFTPEIRGLISAVKGNQNPVCIQDVVAWLSVNSMRSEKIQWQQLQNQVLADVYRRHANETLKNCTPPSDRLSLLNFQDRWEGPPETAKRLAQILDSCEVYALPLCNAALIWMRQVFQKIISDPDDPQSRLIYKNEPTYRETIGNLPAFMYVYCDVTVSVLSRRGRC